MHKDMIDWTEYTAAIDIIHEIAWLLDHGPAADIANLFLPNGTVRGGGFEIVGRAAIRDWAMQRHATAAAATTRHVVTNIRARRADEDLVVTSYLTLYKSPGHPHVTLPVLVGSYVDIMRRDKTSHWRIADRKLDVALVTH